MTNVTGVFEKITNAVRKSYLIVIRVVATLSGLIISSPDFGG